VCGRQNGSLGLGKREQTTRNIEAGKYSPKHPRLPTPPTPFLCTQPAPGARKLGAGAAAGGLAANTRCVLVSAFQPRPPTPTSGRPRPGSRPLPSPGCAPQSCGSAAPRFPPPPGPPLPAAADPGSSREASPASSSGRSPGHPMLRLSAIGGDAAPCRARPASAERRVAEEGREARGRGGGRRSARASRTRGRLEPRPPPSAARSPRGCGWATALLPQPPPPPPLIHVLLRAAASSRPARPPSAELVPPSPSPAQPRWREPSANLSPYRPTSRPPPEGAAGPAPWPLRCRCGGPASLPGQAPGHAPPSPNTFQSPAGHPILSSEPLLEAPATPQHCSKS
jgi:hypothetical protein